MLWHDDVTPLDCIQQSALIGRSGRLYQLSLVIPKETSLAQFLVAESTPGCEDPQDLAMIKRTVQWRIDTFTADYKLYRLMHALSVFLRRMCAKESDRRKLDRSLSCYGMTLKHKDMEVDRGTSATVMHTSMITQTAKTGLNMPRVLGCPIRCYTLMLEVTR